VKWSERGNFDEKLATRKFLKQLQLVILKDKRPFRLFGDESLTDVKFETFFKENAFELRLLALLDLSDLKNIEILQKRLLCELEEIYEFRKVAKIAFSARHF
jgi:hypothetical protein